jgi:hypothetical protein
MLELIETAADLIWDVRPYLSSRGKSRVSW